MYKVCILAAGKGSRAFSAKIINKSLLPIGGQAAISHIINKFPKDIEIVIPVGYYASQVKDFIAIAHSDRKITFVDVDNWKGPGSGPGYSLLSVKAQLDCPFIFTSCDTIILEDVPAPNKNWIGVAPVLDATDFCMAEVRDGLVRALHDKMQTHILLKTCLTDKNILDHAFIGMAGVYDYKTFWEALENNRHQLIRNELQVSRGLNSLIEHKLQVAPFTWFDIGSNVSYEEANKYFDKNKVLLKNNEFIYFEDNLVIKYFADEEIVKRRIERAAILEGFVPQICAHKRNFYAYKKIPGTTLPQVVNRSLFISMLNYYKDNLWKERSLSQEEKIEFYKRCKVFYKEKTEERLKKFYEVSGIVDSEETINGVRTPRLREILNMIEWDWLSKGIPVLFHGDFQPENIIVTPDNHFMLIDWRQDFNGDPECGDIYYELAKMYHALIICGEIIRNNQFEIRIKGNTIEYNYLAKGNLLEYRGLFEMFISSNGYDSDRVRLLTSLVFLNIAPLHHDPYNKFLYYLGKSMLYDYILYIQDVVYGRYSDSPKGVKNGERKVN